jgi:hypothetical protein
VEKENMLFALPVLVMSHLIMTVILNTQQSEHRKIRVPGLPIQNRIEIPSQETRQILGAHACVPSYKRGHTQGGHTLNKSQANGQEPP